MDTQKQALPVGAPRKRRTIQERREIVEETLVPGSSVSRVARRHDVNANQLFYWRKLYREGRLGVESARALLPVKVSSEPSGEMARAESRPGAIEIKTLRGTIRIAGSVDDVALRAVLECLVR